MHHASFMQAALDQARTGGAEGGVPIGCVLVKNGHVVGAGHNRCVQNDSAILHGEMDALEATGRRPGAWYKDVILYTTLSPCAMCTGAILLYGIPHVVIGENASFMGEEAHLKSRGVTVEVLNDPECKALMACFIRDNAALWYEDIGAEPC